MSCAILGVSIDVDFFNADGIESLNASKEKISTDVGWILSTVFKSMSRWMKFDMKKKFDERIPPGEDALFPTNQRLVIKHRMKMN